MWDRSFSAKGPRPGAARAQKKTSGGGKKRQGAGQGGAGRAEERKPEGGGFQVPCPLEPMYWHRGGGT